MARRPAKLLTAYLLVVVLGSSLAVSSESGWARPLTMPVAAHCKLVTKKVHGHRKKVKVCTHMKATPMPTSTPPLFDGPSDVVVDAAGNLLIADQKHRRIATLSSSGAILSSWTDAGNSPSIFDTMYGIALDRTGNVYVTDAANHVVDKLDRAGKPVAQFSTESAEVGSFPTLLAVADNGDIFVADHMAEAVLHLSPTGALLGKIGQHAFADPYAVAIGPNGNVYVSDFGGGRVREYTPDGQAVATWGDGAGGSVRLDSPEAIALDGQGNIVVTEQSGDIVRFDQTGKVLQDYGASGALQFEDPSGVALDGQGNMYVTEYMGNRVDKLSPNGDVLASWK